MLLSEVFSLMADSLLCLENIVSSVGRVLLARSFIVS